MSSNQIDTGRTDLVGIDRPTLAKWLMQAQTAMHELQTGAKIVNVSYAQGDGMKNVTYKHADMGMLRGYIQELKTQLGITPSGRRPIRPFFS